MVFNIDWQYTKLCLEEGDTLISSYGTFIDPKVDIEGNNWGNRVPLLNSYRELVAYIDKHEIDIGFRYFDF